MWLALRQSIVSKTSSSFVEVDISLQNNWFVSLTSSYLWVSNLQLTYGKLLLSLNDTRDVVWNFRGLGRPKSPPWVVGDLWTHLPRSIMALRINWPPSSINYGSTYCDCYRSWTLFFNSLFWRHNSSITTNIFIMRIQLLIATLVIMRWA